MANATIQIGSASFDPGTQRLQVGEQEIRLDPKESAVLLELAASAPNLATREHLLARVWAGTVVGDNALHQVITRLRRALSDDARKPSCIETLPRRGYRLMVPVVWPNGERGADARPAEGRPESGPPTVSFLPLATIGSEPALADYAQTASQEISSCSLRRGGGRVDAPGRWLVGAKGEYPFCSAYPRIPDRDRSNLFEPFFRVDRSRSKKTGGYGLGLSISKRIVEAHGGTIAAENNSRRGASFVVTLPRPA